MIMNQSKHIVDVNTITFPLVLRKELVGSYGEGSHKTLYSVNTIYSIDDHDCANHYEVHINRVEHFSSTSLGKAIEQYNNYQ